MSNKLIYTGNVEKDIYDGYPKIQANIAMASMEMMLDNPFNHSERQEIIQELENNIIDHYKADKARFEKMKSPNNVRDFHLTFCQHWVSSILKKKHPKLFEKLPKSFINGER